MTKLNLTSTRLSLGDCLTVAGQRKIITAAGQAVLGRQGCLGEKLLEGTGFDVIFINVYLKAGINFSHSFNRPLPHWLSLRCKNEGNDQKLALKTLF